MLAVSRGKEDINFVSFQHPDYGCSHISSLLLAIEIPFMMLLNIFGHVAKIEY